MTRKQVTLYTDGSCAGNPGPGGYAVILSYRGRQKELVGGFRQTTNNRMELLAIIQGLSALKEPCSVELHSDSEYVVRAMNEGWPYAWRKKGWRRTRKKGVANRDLWSKLLELCNRHEVRFEWVKGHSGHPMNERCDQLAVEMTRASELPPDLGYENRNGSEVV